MMISEQIIEDIRAEEREKLLEQIRRAADNAVPKETKDYLQGFEDGVRHVSEAVMGTT